MKRRQMKPSETPLVPLTLRLPEELHAQLTNKAHDEERSLNAQVVVLLRSALAGGNCQNSPTHRHAP